MLSWNDIIQKYIINHATLIRKTTKPLQEHFNIGYFTYHRIDNSGKYTVLVDRPEWAEHYVSRQIYLHDPYLRHPSVYRSGMSLIENHGSQEYKEMVLQGGKAVLNMDLGVVLIQKTANCAEFFGFSGNKEASSLQSLYVNHPQVLSSFAAHFKNELGPILTKMEREASSLLDLKGQDFFCSLPIFPDIHSETLLAYYKDLKVQTEVGKLTCRERQCLQLLLEDKTAKEIAVALGLSHRTVEYYFENIKNKYSCWSKKELLQIARRLQSLGLLKTHIL